MSFVGMTVEQAAQQIGKPVSEAATWLRRNGYTFDYDGPRVLRRPRLATEVQDDILARIRTAPPSAPCFRCGARGECAHR